ncbi:MAG TPA: GNAT family N-acetyltransferase [Pyrinomonadaceae bacterium]
MNVEIRLASAAEVATLARLRYELRSSSQQAVEDERAFLGRCEPWMRERVGSGGAWQCWIAERETHVIGAVWAQLVEKIPNPTAEPESYVYLTSFYVREEYRGKGIGSQLLAAVVEWSRSKNAQMIILWPTEESKRFYLRHGFSFPNDLMIKRT